MRRVQPKVFLVGETYFDYSSLRQYLEHVGAPEWGEDNLRDGKQSDAETLVEVMGRVCYRAFKPGLNPNVQKVREGNDVYLANIIKSRHGSVLEHSQTNWIFADVSRVFTHELVRHRVGTAFSQESLRYVRLTDLGLWLPQEIEHEAGLVDLFETTFRSLEEIQLRMADHFHLDEPGTNFETKKKITSAMRRLAPIGLATTIGMSMNFRALRHLVELRTAESAEVEIRLVFDEVAHISKARWPNVFQDFTRNEKGEWVTPNSKI